MTVATTVLVTTVLGACRGAQEPTVPTAGGTPTAAGPGPDRQARELAFVACMRREGIADMPDPVPGDTSGRSAVRYAIDVMGKGSDPLFQAALDECQDLLPELPEEEPPSPEELDALLAFARCMRDHGLPDFADPGRDTQIVFYFPREGEPAPAVTLDRTEAGRDIIGVNLHDPVAAAAWEACRSLFPVEGE